MPKPVYRKIIYRDQLGDLYSGLRMITDVKSAATSYSVCSIDITKQKFVNYEIQATNTKQATVSYGIQTTNTKQATVSYGIQTTSIKQKSTSYKIQTTSTKQAIVSYEIQTQVTKQKSTSYKIQTTSTKQAIVSYEIQTTNTKQKTVNYAIQTIPIKQKFVNYEIQVVGTKQVSTNYEIQTTCTKQITSAYSVLPYNSKTVELSYRVLTISTNNKESSFAIKVLGKAKQITAGYDIGIRCTKQKLTNYEISAKKTKQVTTTYKISAKKTKQKLINYEISAKKTKQVTTTYEISAKKTKPIEVFYRIDAKKIKIKNSNYTIKTLNHIQTKDFSYCIKNSNCIKTKLSNYKIGKQTERTKQTHYKICTIGDKAITATYSVLHIDNHRTKFSGYKIRKELTKNVTGNCKIKTTSKKQKISNYAIKQTFSKIKNSIYNIVSQGTKSLSINYSIFDTNKTKTVFSSYSIGTAISLYPYFSRLLLPVKAGDSEIYVENTAIFTEHDALHITDGVSVISRSISSIDDTHKITLSTVMDSAIDKGAVISDASIDFEVGEQLEDMLIITDFKIPNIYFLIVAPGEIDINVATFKQTNGETYRYRVAGNQVFHFFDEEHRMYPFYNEHHFKVSVIEDDPDYSREIDFTYKVLKKSFEAEGDTEMFGESVIRKKIIVDSLPNVEKLSNKIPHTHQWSVIDYDHEDTGWSIEVIDGKKYYKKQLTSALVYEEILAIVTLASSEYRSVQYRALFLPVDGPHELQFGIKQYPNSPLVFYSDRMLYMYIPPQLEGIPSKLRLFTR